MDRAWLFPILVAGAMVLAVAALGATITDIGPWYHHLVQPRWAPPDAAYGVAWTAIYAVTALAGVTGWLAMPHRREREGLLGLFALNGAMVLKPTGFGLAAAGASSMRRCAWHPAH